MTTVHLWALITALIALAQTPAQPTYVGSDTCGVCHEEVHKGFQNNPHRILDTDKRRGWVNNACEACHGAGGKHVDSGKAADIVNPRTAPAAQVSRLCLQCHVNEPTHVGRIQSGHARNTVACTACHTMHGPDALVKRKLAAATELCRQCHTGEWLQFTRPYKHRLPEGAMSCVDCHNPHGSVQPNSLQAVSANELACLKCHGDLRGPFAFEHAPVRTAGCATCHEPHGSTNPRMLRRHEQWLLCLECHANLGAAQTLGGVPPPFHDVRSARFQNCTICHTQIHGSYIDRFLLK